MWHVLICYKTTRVEASKVLTGHKRSVLSSVSITLRSLPSSPNRVWRTNLHHPISSPVSRTVLSAIPRAPIASPWAYNDLCPFGGARSSLGSLDRKVSQSRPTSHQMSSIFRSIFSWFEFVNICWWSDKMKGMKGFAGLVARSYFSGRTPKPNPSLFRGRSGCYLHSSCRAISSSSFSLSLRNQWPFVRNPSESWVSAPWIGLGGEVFFWCVVRSFVHKVSAVTRTWLLSSTFHPYFTWIMAMKL